MIRVDWLNLLTAISAAVAAGAACGSARQSSKSVKEQRDANRESARAAEKQIAVLSDQATAADRHSKTAEQQARAEAIRWSVQAHLGLATADQASRPSIGLAVAVAEFALFHAGMLPRDFFIVAITRHLASDGNVRRTLSPGGRGQPCLPSILREGRALLEPPPADGDYAAFVRLWEAIGSSIDRELGARMGPHTQFVVASGNECTTEGMGLLGRAARGALA